MPSAIALNLRAFAKMAERDGSQDEADRYRCAATEIDLLWSVIRETEFCLTAAVVTDGHDRCKMALERLRARLKV